MNFDVKSRGLSEAGSLWKPLSVVEDLSFSAKSATEAWLGSKWKTNLPAAFFERCSIIFPFGHRAARLIVAHAETLKRLFPPQIRDDNKRQHPCLVDFSKLPETERNYNLQMSSETLK